MKKLRRLFLVGLLVASYTAAFVACEEDPALTEDDTTQSGENPPLDSTKTALYKPVAIGSVHEYSGNKRYITLAPIYDSLMTVVGDTAVNAGSYTALVALKDTAAYCWKDGSTDTVRVAWRIARKVLYPPTVINIQHQYDGNAITPLRYDTTTFMTITGNIATEIGDYECIASLRDTVNCMWSDGTVADVVIPWQIVAEKKSKTRLHKPASSLTWGTNAEHEPRQAPVYFDETTMRISGNYTYTKGGVILHFYVALKDTANYEWTDGTVDSVPVRIAIHRLLNDVHGASYSLSRITCWYPEQGVMDSVLTHDQLSLYSEKAADIYEYIEDKAFISNGGYVKYGDMTVAAFIDRVDYGADYEAATELTIFEDRRILITDTGMLGDDKIEDFHSTARLVFQNLFFIDGKIIFRYIENGGSNGSEYKVFEFIFEQSGVAPQP